MARIPEAEIERLKNEVAVVRLVEAAGLELKKSGKDWDCTLPLPRRRHREPGGHACEEPVALLRLRRGRWPPPTPRAGRWRAHAPRRVARPPPMGAPSTRREPVPSCGIGIG